MIRRLACLLLLATALAVAVVPATGAATLDEETQQRIILDYGYVTGQLQESQGRGLEVSYADDLEAAVAEGLPVKCGTPSILEFRDNYERLSRSMLRTLGVDVWTRADLPLAFDSPGGRFKIHYAVSGTDAVYQAAVDNDGNSVPDFVDGVADIADSVWAHTIDTLGYPEPPSDGFYPSGGDDRFDIYLRNLPSSIFGLTYPDSVIINGDMAQYTAFIELDNDYQSISSYKDRPLDAVRVTLAHEFFHVVQFGIDPLEAEGFNPDSQNPADSVRRYWMEMSAVWMEEEQYDDINDYYFYLPYYFDVPRVSLQRFDGFSDIHPYASAIFAIFLSERFGRDIIRNIWLRCGENLGPDFLIACDSAIQEFSLGAEDIGTAFREFAVWNYFTGSSSTGRADLAPPGIGYEERQFYPAIPDTPDTTFFQCKQSVGDDCVQYVVVPPGVHYDSVDVYWAIDMHREFPFNRAVPNRYQPHHMAATYIRLDGTRTITPDTTWFVCVDSVGGICNEYQEVPGPPADSIAIDSTLYFFAFAENLDKPWGASLIYQLDSDPDVFVIEDTILSEPLGTLNNLFIANPYLYRSITIVLSAASDNLNKFRPGIKTNLTLGYGVFDQSILDSNYISVPFTTYPYPNPAVVARMASPMVRFKVQVQTDALTVPATQNPAISVDLYNVAGEHVATLDDFTPTLQPLGEFDISWDLRNAAGSEVASGVYIGFVRLYAEPEKINVLGEERVKLLVVR